MSIEAMKLALEALKKARRKILTTEECHAATMAVSQAIEQAQKQEPVGEVELIDIDDEGTASAWFTIATEPLSLGEKLYTSPQQRQPLMDEQGIWVLTSEYNAYDQYGEYFEAVFIGKPTSEQIQKHCHVTELGAAHILSGGGRVEYEDEWYNLRKEEAVYGIKGEV